MTRQKKVLHDLRKQPHESYSAASYIKMINDGERLQKQALAPGNVVGNAAMLVEVLKTNQTQTVFRSLLESGRKTKKNSNLQCELQIWKNVCVKNFFRKEKE